MSTPTLFTNAVLPGIGLRDVLVSDGLIAAIKEQGVKETGAKETGAMASSAARVDCHGLLMAPSLVEGHIHLDKTLLGLPLMPHRPGRRIAERIEHEKELRRNLGASVVARGGALIRQVAASGTGSMRSHVDIDAEIGLTQLEEQLELKARYASLVDIQIVAFPQSGILTDLAMRDLLNAALAEGADLVGGLDPASLDGDVSGHLDVVFGLAQKHGKGIDIHLHDAGDLGLQQLREIAHRTIAAELEGHVAVSHAFCLGDDLPIEATAEALAKARIAIMTNGPSQVPMPPVMKLKELGVTVFAGSDNIRDAWSPYGNGNMLERVQLIGYLQGMNSHQELEHLFEMATSINAGVLGIDGYGLQPGNRADFILLSADSKAEAVLSRPIPSMVVKAGQIIAREGALVDRWDVVS